MINQALSSQTIHQIISIYNSQYLQRDQPNETSNTFALHHSASNVPNLIESYTHFHKRTKNVFANALPFPNPTLSPKRHQARISSFIKDYITFNHQVPQTSNESSDERLFLANASHIYNTHMTALLQKQLQAEYNNSFVDNTSTVIDMPQMVQAQAQQDYLLLDEEDSGSYMEDSEHANNVFFQDHYSNDDYEGTDEPSDNTTGYD